MERGAQMSIQADTNLDELLRRSPEVATVFIEHRMHCVGCPIARFETIADACRIYGKPLETFLHALWSAAGRVAGTDRRGDGEQR